MVHAAYLTPNAEGRYTYDEPVEEDAETMDEFLENVAPGISNEPAPEIVPLVDSLNGGHVFRITDESAARGHEVAYLIAWEANSKMDIVK